MVIYIIHIHHIHICGAKPTQFRGFMQFINKCIHKNWRIKNKMANEFITFRVPHWLKTYLSHECHLMQTIYLKILLTKA